MTREEFAMKWKHEWRGLLLDPGMQGLHGSALSHYLRQLEQKIEQNLNQMFHDAQPATNGTANATASRPSETGRR